MAFFNKYSLASQLAFVFILVFLLSVSVIGIYNFNQEMKDIKSAKFSSMDAIAKSISYAIKEDVYNDDFTAIENKLFGFSNVRDI